MACFVQRTTRLWRAALLCLPERGIVHILTLILLAIVALAGLAIITRGGIEFPGKKAEVLGSYSQTAETYVIDATRAHRVFGVLVNTRIRNVIDSESGEVLEVKSTFSDWLADILSK